MFSELLKLFLSTIMVFVHDAQCNFASFKDAIIRGFVDDGGDCLKLCVPAILYCIQNNLQYVIESAPLFLVLYQSKIITTAIFYSTLLSRRLTSKEWFTIVALALGVSMVESSQHDIQPHHASDIMGILCVATACLTSGFAGVYFEKIVKSTRSSIWMINLQLSLLSSFFCVVSESCMLVL
jgi:UDP-sugar transporter A1/2/3